MINLESIREDLKELLVEDGVGECLISLKAQLPPQSPKRNELLALETRLNKLNRDVLKNEITQEVYDVEYAQMIQLLLLMIDELEAADFEESPAGQKSKQGSILYQIPGVMTLEEESECRIRLAFEETVILDNIRVTKDTELKSIRVSEIMEVEIVDPAAEPNFEIRPMVSKRMFLDKDDYAEWIFFVKPLRTGEHELWLKVSVLEERAGGLVQRDLVMKENVEILAVPAARPVEVVEKVAQYSLHSGSAEEAVLPQIPIPEIPRSDAEPAVPDRPRIVISKKNKGSDKEGKKILIKSDFFPMDELIQPEGNLPGSDQEAPARERPRSWLRIVSYGMTAAVLFVGLSYFVVSFYWDGQYPSRSDHNGLTIEEEETFRKGTADPSGRALTFYLVKYPQGRYVDSALLLLQALPLYESRLDTALLRELQNYLRAGDSLQVRRLANEQLLQLDSLQKIRPAD